MILFLDFDGVLHPETPERDADFTCSRYLCEVLRACPWGDDVSFANACRENVKRCRLEKNMRTKTKIKKYTTQVEKGGRISWPIGVMNWKIGQRVFFSIIGGKLQLTAKPAGLFQGRVLSSRVARKFSSKRWAKD
jgi:hypothetical protein